MKILQDPRISGSMAPSRKDITFSMGLVRTFCCSRKPCSYQSLSNVTCYDCRLPHQALGPVAALFGGPSLLTVCGIAYEVQFQGQLDRLVAFETNKYETAPCLVEFLDGGEHDNGSFWATFSCGVEILECYRTGSPITVGE